MHGPPEPLVPGEEYDVSVVLDACAYAWAPGQTLRVSVAGADWPNTVAPPAPVTLTVISGCGGAAHAGGLVAAPSFSPGEAHSSESTEGVGWEIRSDVLAPHHDGRHPPGLVYDTSYDGRARECYLGEVSVDLRTHRQTAHADTTYELSWPGVAIEVHSVMDVVVTGDGRDRDDPHRRPSATGWSSATGRGSRRLSRRAGSRS